MTQEAFPPGVDENSGKAQDGLLRIHSKLLLCSEGRDATYHITRVPKSDLRIARINRFNPYPSRQFFCGNLLVSMHYYSGHKESNNLHRDIVILRVLRGAELTSQSPSERNIQPAWQSLKLLTRRYLNSGQGNKGG